MRTTARKENTTSGKERGWDKWRTKEIMMVIRVVGPIFDWLFFSTFSCNKKCHEKEKENQPRFSSSALHGNLCVLHGGEFFQFIVQVVKMTAPFVTLVWQPN